MILALDPGRVLGWCRGEPGETLSFGHIELAREGASPGVIGWRLKEFLKASIITVNPNLIVYEQPFLRPHLHAMFILLGIGFSIDAIATEYSIEYGSVMTGEATNGLVGQSRFPGKDYETRRKAKKAATIAACHARGWNAANDHEADAIAMFLLAEAKRFPEAALRRPRALKQPTGPLFNQEQAHHERPQSLSAILLDRG